MPFHLSEIAQVIAAYTATGAEQLTLAPGQLILIRKKNPGGWWEGELQVHHVIQVSFRKLVTTHTKRVFKDVPLTYFINALFVFVSALKEAESCLT